MASEKQFGIEVPHKDCNPPTRSPITGKYVKLHPMQPEHAEALFATIGGETNSAIFDYLPYEPFTDFPRCKKAVSDFASSKEMHFYSIELLTTKQMVGYISYIRIEPSHRKLEIAHVVFSALLQRTTAATEVVSLLLRKAFEENYRRVEWKTNAFNVASRRAAERLGFTFEGVFRQDMIVKGRNRDSAWFSMLDSEWDVCGTALERWMNEGNFDGEGRQVNSLKVIRRELSTR